MDKGFLLSAVFILGNGNRMRLGGQLVAVLCVWTVTAVHVTHAECPHTPAGKTLRSWSDSAGWSSVGLLKPSAGATVVITDDVLLDESPPELSSVEVSAGGSLVFSPDGDYTLTVGYLLLLGSLHIGSEDCKFPASARIVLKASRGQFNVEGYGGKFIGVGEGGTLELHGDNKLGWTKLNSTVPKLTADNGLLYDTLTDYTVDKWNRGLVSLILDGTTGGIKFKKMIYLVGNSDWRRTHEPPQLFAALEEVQDGDVIVLAVQNALGLQDLVPFYDAIETAALGHVTNSLALRSLQPHDAWVLIARRGAFLKEKLETKVGDDKFITAGLVVPFPDLGIVVNVQSKTKPNKETKWRTQGQIAKLQAGARILDVAQDATTWRPGDRLLLTSTDFDWRQAEEAEVIYCSREECNANQVKVLMFPKYTHYGEITDGIDMRGEVALLSRNIVIEGAMQDHCPSENGNCGEFKFDTYGGHIKIKNNFQNVHIEGVELRHMGQYMEEDRYPVHFHMCGDVDKSSTNPAYVRSVAIHHSYSMCVVATGTSGLTIQDNVAYKHYGHCFFLKEGGEKRTVLDGNLGLGTQDTKRTNLERQSTTFLITNPLTYFRNNIAAGGNRRGIWYLFPREPVGESARLGLMERDVARRTAYLQFTNNAAHSYGESGLCIFKELREGSRCGGSNSYRPVVNPEDDSSKEAQEVHLHRYTGFKNRYQNAKIQGGHFIMDQASVSDSVQGLYFYRSSDQKLVLQNSLVVGESVNIGEPTRRWLENRIHVFDRALPLPRDLERPIQGFTVQDGPLELRSVWFNHFTPSPTRMASALGFRPKTIRPSSAVNDVKGLKFGFADGIRDKDGDERKALKVTTGLRFFEGDDSVYSFGSDDADLESILYDVDGSLTGVPETTLVKPFPVFTTSACLDKPDWGMAVCPHKYGKLKVSAYLKENTVSSPILTRDDLSPEDGLQMPFKVYCQFPVIKGGSHSYILHWSNFLPKRVYLYGRGIQSGEDVRIGMCVPRDGKVELYTHRPEWAPSNDRWTEVSTVEELDQSTRGAQYFYDRTNGIIFVKLISYFSRTEDTVEECVSCPMVRLRLLSGDNTDADCRDRIRAYSRSSAPGAHVSWPSDLPATAVTPPEDWGAGEFVPFQTRPDVDGAYGAWSEWGHCTVTCGGGTQIRSRACNSPMPQNRGKPCSGPSEDTQTCSTNPCKIHGQFSDWSQWGA